MEAVLLKPKSKQPQEQLTQAEIQSLLCHTGRDLAFAAYQKVYHKKIASKCWFMAQPDESYGQESFNDFSMHHKKYKHWKQREKMLVNIITKLKGLR